TQERVLPDEDRPTLRVRFQQPLLRPFQHEAEPMQVVQAATASERHPEPLTDILPHHLPIPVPQVDPHVSWRSLDRCLYLGLLLRVEGGGEPPLCSKVRPAGPRSRKTASHSP